LLNLSTDISTFSTALIFWISMPQHLGLYVKHSPNVFCSFLLAPPSCQSNTSMLWFNAYIILILYLYILLGFITMAVL
jgi:hypothetical protein